MFKCAQYHAFLNKMQLSYINYLFLELQFKGGVIVKQIRIKESLLNQNRKIIRKMNSIKSSKEPIGKIVNQISKLKKQLKSIKSTKTIPFLQLNSLPKSLSTDKLQGSLMKKHKTKLTLQKPKQTLIMNQNFEQKQRVQTERKKFASKIDMSICKQIRRSLSKSNSKDKSNIQQQTNEQERNEQKNKQNRVDKSKSQKKRKLKSKTSQFDNVFAHTRSIRKENNNDPANFQLQNTSKPRYPYHDHVIEPFLKQDISFANQQNFKKIKHSQTEQQKSLPSGAKINLKEVDFRVKTNANYEPQFNNLNFSFSYQFNHEKPPQASRKQNLISTYTFKSEILFNKLKKTLMRYPNFSALLQQQKGITIQAQRILNQINEKSSTLLQQRYTQYLQQVQCEINQIINLFNQYQNQRENFIINNKNPQSSTNFLKQKNGFISQKENCLSMINLNQGIGQDMVENQQEALKKQIKQTRKHIKKLERQIREKDEQFMELQFKYVLKCEQEENCTKFNNDIIPNLSQNQFIPNLNHNIQSHIQILQEQNLQLYQKIEFLTRQIDEHLLKQRQNAKECHLNFKTIDQLKSQLQRQRKTKQLQDQDFNMAQIQIDSLKQKISKLTEQRQSQREKYKKKVLSVQLQNEELSKKLQVNSQSFKITQQKAHQLEIQNYKLQQTLSSNQAHFQRQITDLKRQNQKYERNENIINKKVQELTKDNFTLRNTSQNLIIQNDKLKINTKHLAEEMTGYRQRLLVMEKIDKMNESLKRENSRLLSRVEELEKQLLEKSESVQLLKAQLQIEYKRLKQLQESIERYKDRCVKAEIQLKQERYLEKKSVNKERCVENTEQIKKMIKSHKEKLNISE